MRALTVIAEMGSGGAETVVADLAGHLVERGHEVGVASSGGWRADELAREGIDTLDVPLRAPGPASVLRTAARLRREVGRRPVDLVHAHNVRASVAAHLGTRGAPMLTTVHGLADADYARAARLLRRSDLVVAVSQDVADRLADAGLEGERIRVVENAVPTPPVPDRAAARSALGLPRDLPVVLCVARLAAPKRVDLLLDAWPDVPAALLLVAGDGPDRPDLERRTTVAGLGERVDFLGDRRDVARLLAAADLLVLPTDREGLPMTVLEAMAAGVPVVASAVGGLRSFDPEVVELVAPGSARALGAAVARVLGDPARGRRLAEAASELVRRRYSSPGMRSAYENVYEELLRGRIS
jgi:glycosyltransferase involved in cell wall biosynthesis